MTKSTLKEMIKAAMVADTAVYEAEYDSDIENQTEEDFGFWFKAGVKSEKQIQQAKDLLTQNGIEFNAEGRFGIDFQGKGYEKREIVQLLRDNGLTLFVIYDHEKDDKMEEGDNYYEDSMEDLKEVSLNASELETAIAALSGILGLPAVAYLSQLAQDKLEDIKAKLAEGDLEEGTWTRYEDMTDEEKEAFDSDMNEAEDVEVEDNEEVDVDIEKDVKIDDESVESDIEVDASMPGESADEVAVQSLLMKAQEEAAKLGDEKLTDQIGNTITYFTRAHVATVDEGESDQDSVIDVSVDNPAEDAEIGMALDESISRFAKLAGIIK
jgi:hypothetical protein